MDGGATFPIQEGTLIVIRTSAELNLSGIEESEVRLYGSEERVQVRQEEGVFRIENHSGMDLSVPMNANVRVERVGGDAFLQDLGSLELHKVGGNLAMQRIGQAQIGRVGGDLMVREVTGPFVVQKVGGNLLARELGGPVTVESVGGDGDIQAAGGETFTLRVGGNALVQLTRDAGREVNIYAGGDAALFLPADVSAQLEVHAGGEEIVVHLNRQSVSLNETIEHRHYSQTLGGGDGRIDVHAGGTCEISDEAREPSSLAGEFERLEHSWQNARENRERYGWPGRFDPDRWTAWSELVGRRAQEAARRAELRAQSAVRRAEEHARRMEERTRRTVEREMGRDWNPFEGGPKAPPPPPPPVSPVTEQERLMILQMLRDNKITVEQAEALLRALEGRYKE